MSRALKDLVRELALELIAVAPISGPRVDQERQLISRALRAVERAEHAPITTPAKPKSRAVPKASRRRTRKSRPAASETITAPTVAQVEQREPPKAAPEALEAPITKLRNFIIHEVAVDVPVVRKADVPLITAPTPRDDRRWSRPCKAVNAENGRRCGLPAHPKTPNDHHDGRAQFSRVAAPGQTPFADAAEKLAREDQERAAQLAELTKPVTCRVCSGPVQTAAADTGGTVCSKCGGRRRQEQIDRAERFTPVSEESIHSASGQGEQS